MTILQISLFGTVRIRHSHCSAETRVTPKAQGLLAYLLLQGARLHSREILTDLFWESHPPGRARSALSTTLWRLRRVLEPEGVPTGTYLATNSKGEIGFNWESNYRIDAIIFEEQINRFLRRPLPALQPADIRSVEAAFRFYTGDLLEPFYDDWIISKQERFRCLYLDGLEHLMRYYSNQALFEKSLACGRQILEREPLREEVHREMMRLYLESGHPALAIRQYEHCRHILERELAISPMEETQALYGQVLAASGPARVTVQIERVDLQQALRRFNLAANGFGQARRYFQQAIQELDQAHDQLQEALQLIERVSEG